MRHRRGGSGPSQRPARPEAEVEILERVVRTARGHVLMLHGALSESNLEGYPEDLDGARDRVKVLLFLLATVERPF